MFTNKCLVQYFVHTGMRVGSDEKNGNWCEAKKTELNHHYIGN